MKTRVLQGLFALALLALLIIQFVPSEPVEPPPTQAPEGITNTGVQTVETG